MFSKGVAMDYRPHSIRCNVVCPGTIAASMYYDALSGDPARRSEQVELEERLAPLGRFGTPAEVAKLWAFSYLMRGRSSPGRRLWSTAAPQPRCFAYPRNETPGYWPAGRSDRARGSMKLSALDCFAW